MKSMLGILLRLVLSMLRGVYRHGLFRLQRPNEPPLDKGSIPWLGHGLDLRKNLPAFLLKMQKKHGDIFTVQVGGAYYTFLMDPLSFQSVVKEFSSKMDGNAMKYKWLVKLFGYDNTSSLEPLHKSTKTHLMGSGLVDITQAMSDNFKNVMLHDVNSEKMSRSWQQSELFQFSFNIIFRASYLTLFGNESAKQAGSREKAKEIDRIISEELFHEFRKFDNMFPSSAFDRLPPEGKQELERLKKYFWTKLSMKNQMNKDNISRWVTDQQTFFTKNRVPSYMLERSLFLKLWISETNTGPAGFWILLFLMKNPEALKAVKEEIKQVIKASEQEVKPNGPLLSITRHMMLKTPVLNSAMEEALRLAAAPLIVKVVLEDMTLKMADGREYAIRKGDRVAMFPYIAVHMDPEVHPEPHLFKYNRFLNADGTRKVDFCKNGKRLKYFTMPFGAGDTICSGRSFAVNVLKQLVFLMLTYFELELVNPKEDIPLMDHKRAGFGVMPPNHDILFRYRLIL
ncbi:7-alpha-hydroxycholest-4-en-3-one 12-alpha-hydroxylase-like [Ambystoma mexicanum]|uniref:7-alpha-hydroxycholest-4-en-3-one 12-alpha-hydroxylase-like n=1 Tax=Ambystoma mexicanum TaxID=8296 RepID=UPI0037E76611